MGIFDLYSKRQKRLNEPLNDVYTYTDIPEALRVQIVHIWVDALGSPKNYDTWDGQPRETYRFIVEMLCREYGVFKLPFAEKYGDRNHFAELCEFLLKEKNVDRIIDVIEISFRAIDNVTREFNYMHKYSDLANRIADDAINELNQRFLEHSVGYQFTDGNVIRIDSELIHSEIVKPTLTLLHQKQYQGAQDEFLKAHKHYRNGNVKDALVECLKALESTMKVICTKRKWKFPSNANASTLIQVCFDNGLIPLFWNSHFTALRNTLETGVPTARNKLGGHGQGEAVTLVPQHIAAYVIHLTASCITFLVDADSSLD